MGFKDIKYDIPICHEGHKGHEGHGGHGDIPAYMHLSALKSAQKKVTCALFFKCMGFKDIKYDIPVAHSTWHVFPFNWSPIQHSTGPPIQFVPKFRTMC